MNKILLLFCFLFLWGHTACAQGCGDIYGFVFHVQAEEPAGTESHDPLINASVFFLQQDTIKYRCITGADGFYAINSVPAGRYDVLAVATGYRKVLVKRVLITPGEVTRCYFRLGENLVVQKDTFVITYVHPLIKPENVSRKP